MSKVSRKQARRRYEIIESAIPLITSESFDEISVSDICKAVGISIGTFYHYFSKKSDLLIGLLWLIDEDLSENVFPQLTDDNELANLRAFSRGWARHIALHGLERSKLISAINPENADFPEKERESVRKLRELFVKALDKGQIRSSYSADLLTEYFLLMIRGISTDWSRRDGSYDIIEKMDECTMFFIDGCRNQTSE